MTSVSPGSAPAMAMGPTSPGHLPPARSYQSPHSVSDSSTSPALTVRTGGRAAKVGCPTVGFRRCVSATARPGTTTTTSTSAARRDIKRLLGGRTKRPPAAANDTPTSALGLESLRDGDVGGRRRPRRLDDLGGRREHRLAVLAPG